MEKKEKKSEPIKPLILVRDVDKEGHEVLKCTDEKAAEVLRSALDSPKGVIVESPEGKTCPVEPNVPYEKSACRKIEKIFEKRKEKESENK